MSSRILLCLSHDFSYCSISRILAIEEVLIAKGYDCALWANQSHIDRLPDGCRKIFSAPPVRMETLASCKFPLSSCADFFAAVGFDNIQIIELFFRSISSAIKCYKPDVVITDFCPVGSIAARAYQIPLLSTLRWTYHSLHPENQLDRHPHAREALNAFNELLCRLGLESTKNVAELIYSGATQLIVPSIPLLEPGIVNVPHLKWVGPLISNRLELSGNTGGWSYSNPKKKRVYVYLDPVVLSIADQWEMLFKAFKGSDWSVMLSAPKGYNRYIDQTSDNVECIIQAAGRTMIEFADVYITHCGSNSTQLSILSFTPVVAMTGDSLERRSNASALKRLGLATILDDTDVNPQRILDECEGYFRFNPTDEAIYWREFIHRYQGASEIPAIITSMDGVK